MTLAIRALLFSLLLLPASVVAQAGAAAFEAGRAHMRANEPSKAEKEFERAIKAEPDVGEYHMWLGFAVGEQVQGASKLRQPFMARRIRSSFERAVALDPSLLGAREGLLQFYLQAPGFMGGSQEKAQEQQRAIAEQDALRGHFAALEVATHARDTVAAEAALRAAIAEAPDSARATILLAQRQLAWRRTDDAFDTLEAFLARHPADVAVRFQFGRLAAVSGARLERGESALRGLLADPSWDAGGLLPALEFVHLRLGNVLERLGRKVEARAEYEAALRVAPDMAAAKDALKALGTG